MSSSSSPQHISHSPAEHTGPWSMLPPPANNKKFNDIQDAINWINDWGATQGYGVLQKSPFRNALDSEPDPSVRFQCQRSSKYNGRRTRKHLHKFEAGCPFKGTVRMDPDSGYYTVTMINRSHNHPGSPPEELLAHRQRTFEEQSARSYCRISFRGRFDKEIEAQDIESSKLFHDENGLRDGTALQTLLDELPRDGTWLIRYTTDQSGRQNMLFMMHKTSLKLLQAHPYLLWMDCTFTSKFFPMPLFNIVGVASNNKSFNAGFAFMVAETPEVYISVLECLKELYHSFHIGSDPIMEAKASSTLDSTHDQHHLGPSTVITNKKPTILSAIGKVFPRANSMICLRQILNDVQKHAKPAIRKYVQRYSGQPKDTLQAEVNEQWDIMKDKWCHLVSAYDDVDTIWNSFKEDYWDPIFEKFITYLQSEWLSEVSGCPRSFLRYHTKHYLHFDETTTSRVQGAHRSLRQNFFKEIGVPEQSS
ncbi:hypothetical protein N7535_002181 [Penicillium sp. DV-2018c]|nr:hypothetical protein N7461_004574 [Penicillium sp. DV-2018c]KAJ5583561.1 hypothetical protein N7535_002181 [Penicillium sp. DV-2018c]